MYGWRHQTNGLSIGKLPWFSVIHLVLWVHLYSVCYEYHDCEWSTRKSSEWDYAGTLRSCVKHKIRKFFRSIGYLHLNHPVVTGSFLLSLFCYVSWFLWISSIWISMSDCASCFQSHMWLFSCCLQITVKCMTSVLKSVTVSLTSIKYLLDTVQ